ncbi:SLATT domain-containing protein [Paenibacillus graminis]|uniref:SLATT domain-containing protein n=1 Tax=Paenibacillus graminis TaxID=189425 RepID=UPI002DBE5916|nr:SLATT domain-containing protein [Paenibacillus graminis]MEC0168639.1 SLATT domain-containing protein [Paenibacillus graminis]
MSKINVLIGFIKLDMDACKKAGEKLLNRAWWFKLASIAISFFITIILGITLNTEENLFGINAGMFVKNTAVILSALLTAINTWDAFGNFQTRSSQETAMINKLNMLLRDICLYIEKNDNCSSEKYNEFKQRYNSIQEEYVLERSSKDEDNSENKNTEEGK